MRARRLWNILQPLSFCCLDIKIQLVSKIMICHIQREVNWFVALCWTSTLRVVHGLLAGFLLKQSWESRFLTVSRLPKAYKIHTSSRFLHRRRREHILTQCAHIHTHNARAYSSRACAPPRLAFARFGRPVSRPADSLSLPTPPSTEIVVADRARARTPMGFERSPGCQRARVSRPCHGRASWYDPGRASGRPWQSKQPDCWTANSCSATVISCVNWRYGQCV